MTTERGNIPEPDASRNDDLSPMARFEAAQGAFEALLAEDFPDFDREQYAAEKAEAENIDDATLSSRIWSEARSVPQRLDITGDGRIDVDDARTAARLAKQRAGAMWSAARSVKADDVNRVAAAAKSAIADAGSKVAHADYKAKLGQTGRRIKDAARHVDRQSFRSGGHTLLKVAKSGVGIQGIQDRQAANETKVVCEEYAAAAESLTDFHRVELNECIEEFGKFRLSALHDTLGRFLRILETLQQRNKAKEYELLADVGIDTQTLESFGRLDMTVSESLNAALGVGALGAVAILGTPALVTGTVTAFAAASTGTAISTLSGAAANSAVLAWLGGGSVAAGGGGMAAGGLVFAGITAGTTAGVALLAAGILVSTHYAKKLTEAKVFEKDTALAVASLEHAWAIMQAIEQRVDELSSLTDQVKARLTPELDKLEASAATFDANDIDDASLFNMCGLLVKTMVELAQTPLLDDDGSLSDESLTVTAKVQRVLNTEV